MFLKLALKTIYHNGRMPGRVQLRPAVSLRNTSSNRSQDNTDVKWLWELDETQREFHKANLSGTRIGTFVITLNTAKPLSASDFKKAIEHSQRKIPHWRTYVRRRGDSFWFCQPAEFKPSFQVLEDVSNTREVIYDMINNLMQNPETTSFDVRISLQKDDAVCQIPELKQIHPFQYSFLFTGHNSFMDGLGGTYLTRCVMEILLNIMNGEAVDDEQCVSFFKEKEIPALLSHFKQRLIEDADFSTAVRETLPPPGSIPLIFQAFPRPNPAVATTKMVTDVIEPKSYSYFKLRCKREGVTLNSFIVAVINIALMELAREKGIITDSYSLSPCVLTSYRRYKKETSDFYLGPCSGVLSFRSTVDVNTMSNFWHYCKSLNNDIHSYIKEGLPLHQGALNMLNDKEQSYDYTSNLRPILNDYVVTNLGDLTNPVPGSDLIKVSGFRTMNFIHNSFHTSLHEVTSFNNRLYYTLSYPTNCLSDETAQMFLNKIFSIFEYISKKSHL